MMRGMMEKERYREHYEIFLLSLMVSWALTLTSPPAAIAEPFSSPLIKHGVYDPRIAAYIPPFKKKTTPLH
jgi:hypothetical protein